ncbi:MAG: tyrosine recombinase XerC [Vicinamibacterales bacterium]
MKARGPRETIATGVYKDALGVEARASAAGRSKWRRFKRGTRLSTIVAWQEETRTALRKAARTRAAQFRAGTLAGDVATYVATLPERARKQKAALFAAWLTAELRQRRRQAIPLDELRRQVSAWVDAGVAASTINHRRRALIELYEAIDGEDPPALPRRLKRQREPAPVPRAHDMALLAAIVEGMRAYPYPEATYLRNRRQARLRLMLWTGVSPTTLAQLTPHSIDLERREIALPARGKGRGAPALTLPLWDPEGIAAAQGWLRAFAWSRKVDAKALAVSLAYAVRGFRRRCPEVPLPPHIRLHDLRHSFLTMVARRTQDPRVVQWYGQHADLKTSMRYILAAVPDIARAALAVPHGVPHGPSYHSGR